MPSARPVKKKSSVASKARQHPTIEVASDVPLLKELAMELNQAVRDSWDFYQRNAQADDTRYCLWDGQSDDGRKHESEIGAKPFPWENASDTRIRLADEIVNEHVRLLMTAFFRGKAQSVAVGSEDARQSFTTNKLMQWLFKSRMLMDLRREVELLLQWREHYGATVLWLSWQKEMRWDLQELTLDALVMMAKQQQTQGDPSMAAMVAGIFDETQEDGVIEHIQSLASWLSVTEARKIVTDLRTEGRAEFPVQYTFMNCPKWEACRIGYDVIFPRVTADIQRARFVSRTEFVTETELQDRILSDGYSEAFVEEAMKHKGKSSRDDMLEWVRRTNRSNRAGFMMEDYKDLIELKHTYYKASYRGGIKVFCTIYHALVKDLYAKHEADVYESGLYPCAAFVREWGGQGATIMDSRGVSELTITEQMEIKTQRDARMDRTSITIRPPVKHPLNRGKFELLIGPGVKVPERRPGEISWMTTPQYDPTSSEVEMSVKKNVANYHGLIDESVMSTKLQLFQQHLVDTCLIEFSIAVAMTLQMAEQYLGQEEVERVVGPLAQTWKKSRTEIQNQYDLMMFYDVRDLDTEFAMKKLEAVAKVILPMDTQGVVDRAGLVKEAMGAIDSRWADQYVRTASAAADMEVDDEQVAYTKIFAGAEPVMKTEGQNFALRKQVLEGIFKANPEVQRRYQTDEIFQKLMKTRMEHFDFMLQQQQNAQIGRVGAKPALGLGLGE